MRKEITGKFNEKKRRKKNGWGQLCSWSTRRSPGTTALTKEDKELKHEIFARLAPREGCPGRMQRTAKLGKARPKEEHEMRPVSIDCARVGNSLLGSCTSAPLRDSACICRQSNPVAGLTGGAFHRDDSSGCRVVMSVNRISCRLSDLRTSLRRSRNVC